MAGGRLMIATAVTVAALAATGASAAQAAVLKNDGFGPGDPSNCQLGFAAEESAAAGFAAPAADYPIRIDSLKVLGCNSTMNVNLEVFPDDLDSDADPEGGASYTSPAPVSLAPGLQTFDISGAGTYVLSGGLRVAVTGVTEGVELATDADGTIVQPNNTVALKSIWNFSSAFAFTQDFVIRADYTALSGVEITKRPKAIVKTRRRKARVTFEFEIEGDNLDFECKLDDGAFKDCSSPHVIKVGKGPHTFEVRAVSGSVAGDPESYSFKVKRR
jgi:hypothetical protein